MESSCKEIYGVNLVFVVAFCRSVNDCTRCKSDKGTAKRIEVLCTAESEVGLKSELKMKYLFVNYIMCGPTLILN